MVEETMFSGESKNIEYKVSLPDKSEKYMKTIVAFANTQGGKLIVGVDDKTHQIVGVENDVLFQLMDGIANAVSDSCVPQIIPDIEPQTVDGKTVIVVSVEAGKNRPYYLKSKGKDNGTYIRVAGTSRQAFPEKIKSWKWKEPESHGMSLLVWVILFQRKQQRNFVRISKSSGRRQEWQSIL